MSVPEDESFTSVFMTKDQLQFLRVWAVAVGRDDLVDTADEGLSRWGSDE